MLIFPLHAIYSFVDRVPRLGLQICKDLLWKSLRHFYGAFEALLRQIGSTFATFCKRIKSAVKVTQNFPEKLQNQN